MSAPVAVKAAQPTTPAPSRMSLRALVKGRQAKPLRIVLYSPEGCGKSTFASQAPAPIFLASEDGTSQLDVTRFAKPEKWEDVLEAVRTLTDEPHDFKTLVVDTLDHVEPLVFEFICRRDKQPNVDAYPYGKGFTAALDCWRILLSALERMQEKTGMHLILLAHATIRTFKSPDSSDFDFYSLKLNDKASGLIREWCEAVLFANYETLTTKDDKTKRVRGISTGARIMHTQKGATFVAKNRYSLPEVMPLSWPDFETAVAAHQTATPEALISEITRKLKQLGGKLERDSLVWIEKEAKGDAKKLAMLNDRINFKLAEQAAKEVA